MTPHHRRQTTTVSIKVPPPSEREQRAVYEAVPEPERREAWVQRQIGPNGVYVARPKNDGGAGGGRL